MKSRSQCFSYENCFETLEEARAEIKRLRESKTPQVSPTPSEGPTPTPLTDKLATSICANWDNQGDVCRYVVPADFARQLERELSAERNLHGQTRVVVEELNTICNDLRNAGQPQFIRSEAIRLLREDQAALRAESAALRERCEGLERGLEDALRLANKNDDQWDESCDPDSLKALALLLTPKTK